MARTKSEGKELLSELCSTTFTPKQAEALNRCAEVECRSTAATIRIAVLGYLRDKGYLANED